MPAFLFHTAENLQYIRQSWGDLQALRYPGTNRPWRQLFLDPEKRDAQNRAAAGERAERFAPRIATGPQWLAAEPQTAAGASPSPALDDVLDTIASTENLMFWLEDMARDVLGFSRTCTRCRHPGDDHHRSGGIYPCATCHCHDYRRGATTGGEPSGRHTVHAPYVLTADDGAPWRRTFTPSDREWTATPAPSGSLHWACMWIESSLDVIAKHDDFAAVLSEEVAKIRHRIAAAVGEVEDGMTLKAPCISCRGIDAATGQVSYTLRLRAKPAPVILCGNPECEPSDALCGSWVRGRPAWPQSEWDWLAERIRDAESPVAA